MDICKEKLECSHISLLQVKNTFFVNKETWNLHEDLVSLSFVICKKQRRKFFFKDVKEHKFEMVSSESILMEMCLVQSFSEYLLNVKHLKNLCVCPACIDFRMKVRIS